MDVKENNENEIREDYSSSDSSATEYAGVSNVQVKKSLGSRIVDLLKRNILVVILLLALIIVFAWLKIENSNQEEQFVQEKTELVSKYENTIDKLKIDNIKFASEVFSWSVRSELLRNNVENLNQLVSVFVKKSNVSLVQIVDIEKNVVILSSDKKYEGEPYTGDTDISNTESIVKNTEEGKSQIITPIMGFNSKIGLLVVTL